MSLAPDGALSRVRRVGARSTWVQRSLLVGAVLTALWVGIDLGAGLAGRTVKDLSLFVAVPATLALIHDRGLGDLGWRVDRRVVRHTAALALFVAPFYVVGSSLPTVRAFYPMWETSLALRSFAPHALQILVLALAAETYYRGLLCVGVRDLGPISIFLSPVVYAFVHVHKPPVELLLSGPTDVLFGAVDYRSNSVVPSMVAHGGGLVLLDWLVLRPPVLAPETVAGMLSWLPLGL